MRQNCGGVSGAIEAGYRSNSPPFRQIVNQTLAKSDQFKRVGHWIYNAK